MVFGRFPAISAKVDKVNRRGCGNCALGFGGPKELKGVCDRFIYRFIAGGKIKWRLFRERFFRFRSLRRD